MLRNITKTLVILAALASAGCAHFRTVEEGEFFRSGQMGAMRLERTLQEHTIHTVISLRSPNPQESWYSKERALCKSAGVAHHDLPWSKDALPTPESLSELIELYRESEGPLLVHCQGGVHRSAVAAACYLLLRGESLDQARKQLGAFFNDAPIGELFDLYKRSDAPFEAWVEDTYPDEYARATRQAE